MKLCSAEYYSLSRVSYEGSGWMRDLGLYWLVAMRLPFSDEVLGLNFSWNAEAVEPKGLNLEAFISDCPYLF